MKNKEALALLDKYLAGACTPQERLLVERAFNFESPENGEELSEENYLTLKSRIWSKLQKKNPSIRSTFKLWPQPSPNWLRGVATTSMAWKIAAAVAVITLGIWLYYTPSVNGLHPEFISGSPLVNDVAPGKNMATITLANGKIINLSDAKTGIIIEKDGLAYNDGSAVANLSPSGREGVAREGNSNNPLSPQGGSLPEGERSMMLTASTPRGGTYQVTLPDGTLVWLNADTKISFPSQFSGKERRILLINGEAYFEVYKNKKMPFVVESKSQQVEVLGTHFNISAYKDEAIVKTTLLEGSVRVAYASASRNRKTTMQVKEVILRPNQQSVVTSDNRIAIAVVDPALAIAWKDGYFKFRDEKLGDIMKTLARWYDVEINYVGDVANEAFTGKIARNKNISQVLSMLEKTKGVHFKVEGRRITITD